MKKLFNLIIITFVASFLIACSFNSSSPEAVVENYINYCAKGDIDSLMKIIDLGDKEFKSDEEEVMRGKISMMTEDTKSKIEEKKGLKSVKTEKATLTEDGNHGIVKVNIKYGNDEEKQEYIKIINRDGKWKIFYW